MISCLVGGGGPVKMVAGQGLTRTQDAPCTIRTLLALSLCAECERAVIIKREG